MRMRAPSSAIGGSVLVVVLWASLALVSVALLFGQSMLMNYRGVDNDVAGRQADQAIEGAIRYAISLLTDEQIKGTLPDTTSYEAEAVPVGEAEFWFLGRADGDATGTTREYALVDEASRINLNTAPALVLSALGISDDLVSAIIDWRTSANAGNATPTAKGGPFESVEELALVPGMTREILYGEDANLNGVLDANEDDGERSLPADNSDGKLDPGIFEYLTVFTEEPNVGPDGATKRVISVSQTIQAELQNLITDQLPGHGPVNVPQGTTYPTPVALLRAVTPPLTDEDIDKIFPYLASPDPQNPQLPLVKGLINVNTASEAVLTAIVGQDVASQIISTRQGRGTPSTGFAWVLPLLQNVPPALTAYLTGQSYQVTADVAAVGRFGRGYRRVRAVIDLHDLKAEKPQIIYRRNLAPLGWALGRDVREQLALKKNAR